MKQATIIAFCVMAVLIFFTSHAGSELSPVVGLSAFGGAERGHLKGVDNFTSGIGGTELFGLYPFNPTFGLQGRLMNQGGESGYRLGASIGPVFDYGKGKFGLFGDYTHYRKNSLDYYFLSGQWAHYFENFDLVVSYSQPVSGAPRRTVTDTRLLAFDPDTCGAAPFLQTRTRKVRLPAINELKSYVRIYPTERIEVVGGFLVNSFAGPDRNKTGTGFGGVFGLGIQVLDWMVIRAVQGQVDTRDRFRVTSGLEFFWSPVRTDKPDRLRADEERDTSFAVASAATGIAFPSIDPG